MFVRRWSPCGYGCNSNCVVYARILDAAWQSLAMLWWKVFQTQMHMGCKAGLSGSQISSRTG